MYNILTLNKISEEGLKHFDSAKYAVSDNIENPEAILLRSFSMHEYEAPESLLAVGRAGAGVNNIPIDDYAKKGIVVFNTPGANANAVKELVIAGLLLASRDIIGGAKWVETIESDTVAKDVEKGKKAFIGPEVHGKTLGVIGLGAIGVRVANTALHLGMHVVGYDPFLSVDAAWGLSRHVEKADSINAIFEKCDYITLHLPYNKNTAQMINGDAFASMKDGVRLLNFSRGELVDIEALKAAIDSGKVAKYVCDFPSNELKVYKNVIMIPHLGASTPESEDNCASMAAKEIIEYLENGNIINSVNYPAVSAPKNTKVRIAVIHDNIPNVISSLSNCVAKLGINIENLLNSAKGENAYTIIDVNTDVELSVKEEMEKIEGVRRVRII